MEEKGLMDPRTMELRVNECVKKIATRETHKQGVGELLELIEHHVDEEEARGSLLRALAIEMGQSIDYMQPARVELVSIYGLMGQMFGASLGAQQIPKIVAVLCDRLRVDNDAKVVQAIGESMATLCEECIKPNSAPCRASFDRSTLLDVFVAPLFKLMREPHPFSQSGGSRALLEVVTRFPDARLLDGAFVKMAVPLLKFFDQRGFAGRPHVLSTVLAMLQHYQEPGTVDKDMRQMVLPQCLHAVVSAMENHRNEHEWPVRVTAAQMMNLLVSKMGMIPDEISLRKLGVLQHDKVNEVRAEALKAAQALLQKEELREQSSLFYEHKVPPPNDATLSKRTPIRSRERNASFAATTPVSEVQIFVKEGASFRQSSLADVSNVDINNSNNNNESTSSDLKTILKQQEDIIQSVNALRKAVEAGMRTLSARVHTVEETLQDLLDAVDEKEKKMSE